MKIFSCLAARWTSLAQALLCAALLFIWCVDAHAHVGVSQSINTNILGRLLNKNSADSEQCKTDSECPAGELCQDSQCVKLQTFMQHRNASESALDEQSLRGEPTPGALQQCGQDRRCRIERLKARNALRRQLAIYENEREIQAMARELEENQKRDVVRLHKPLLVALNLSPFGSGFTVGYSVLEPLRVEGTLLYQSGSVYSNQFYGYHSGTFGALHATYYAYPSRVSPYLSAGFMLGQGSTTNYDSYRVNFGSDSSNNNDLTTSFHILHFAGGIDIQFYSGFQTRLGVKYGVIIYNQARYGAGSYDKEVRDGLKDWMKDDALFSMDFLIGWAF